MLEAAGVDPMQEEVSSIEDSEAKIHSIFDHCEIDLSCLYDGEKHPKEISVKIEHELE